MRRRSALLLLCIGVLSACSRGGSYPAEIAPLQADAAAHGGPLSDSSGTVYGDADQVMCNLTLTDGPVVVPARLCAKGGGTIEGEAFQALLQSPIAQPPTRTGAGATEVALRKQGGVHAVPVKINDAFTLPFLVDSGSASVSLPADVVQALVRLGTITPADFLGSHDYRLADGSLLASPTFRIRSLRIGDMVLQNVTGSMAPVHGRPLLGQSFLGRFRAWSIDNDRQVLVLDGR